MATQAGFDWNGHYECKVKTKFGNGSVYAMNPVVRPIFGDRDVYVDSNTAARLRLEVGDIIKCKVVLNELQRPQAAEAEVFARGGDPRAEQSEASVVT